MEGGVGKEQSPGNQERREVTRLVNRVIKEILTAGNNGKDPLEVLRQYAGSGEHLRGYLVPAQEGINYCIDERDPIGIVTIKGFTPLEAPLDEEKLRREGLLKSPLPGGFLAVVAALVATGKGTQEAIDSAIAIYEEHGWTPEGHTDNEHGHLKDPHKLMDRRKGCGFGKVSNDVMASVVAAANQVGIEGIVEQPETIDYEQVLSEMLARGGRLVVLGGDHYSNAELVFTPRGQTVNRVAALEAGYPVFVAGIEGIMGDPNFVEVFNRHARTNLTPQELTALGLSMTLKTAELLNALKVEGEKFTNVHVLSAPSSQEMPE